MYTLCNNDFEVATVQGTVGGLQVLHAFLFITVCTKFSCFVMFLLLEKLCLSMSVFGCRLTMAAFYFDC